MDLWRHSPLLQWVADPRSASAEYDQFAPLPWRNERRSRPRSAFVPEGTGLPLLRSEQRVDPQPPGAWGTAATYYSDYRTARRPDEQLSLGRNFRIREKMAFSVRAEFFNVFNRVYLNNPDSTNALAATVVNQATGQVTSGFGRINTGTTFNPPRSGQIVARFTF